MRIRITNFIGEHTVSIKTRGLFTPIQDVMYNLGLIKNPYLYDVMVMAGGFMRRKQLSRHELSMVPVTAIAFLNPPILTRFDAVQKRSRP